MSRPRLLAVVNTVALQYVNGSTRDVLSAAGPIPTARISFFPWKPTWRKATRVYKHFRMATSFVMLVKKTE